MLILGIETSCDDTAAALVEVQRGRFVVRKNLVASQAKLHAKYKGVVPEVAARAHLETIVPVINEVLNPLLSKEGLGVVARKNAPRPTLTPPSPLKGEGISKLDAIAVTAGPGLITSLLVGVETAKALSFAWNVPLVGVNHIEGHIYSVTLPSVETRHASSLPRLRFPAIALIVSGGHTELILMTNRGQYKLLGRTRDDAAGETFDKAAAMLGLPYPGGPEISKLAEAGNPAAFALPRPMLDHSGFEFSFSGLKNAIRLLIEKIPSFPRACPEAAEGRGRGGYGRVALNNLCASIEQAIVDVMVAKSLASVTKHHPKTFILAGGVGANKKLRATLACALPETTNFLLPAPAYCQDNAAMIAAAAYHHIKNKNFTKYDKLKADANWELV